MENCEIPEASKYRGIAGPELALGVAACKEEVFVHNYGPSFRKYYFAAKDQGVSFYVHCKDRRDVMAFREIVPKLVSISLAVAGCKVDVTMRAALSGNIILKREFEPVTRMHELRFAAWEALATDKMAVSGNTPVKLILNDKILNSSVKLITVLNGADKKLLKDNEKGAAALIGQPEIKNKKKNVALLSGQLKITKFAMKK